MYNCTCLLTPSAKPDFASTEGKLVGSMAAKWRVGVEVLNASSRQRILIFDAFLGIIGNRGELKLSTWGPVGCFRPSWLCVLGWDLISRKGRIGDLECLGTTAWGTLGLGQYGTPWTLEMGDGIHGDPVKSDHHATIFCVRAPLGFCLFTKGSSMIYHSVHGDWLHYRQTQSIHWFGDAFWDLLINIVS